jgi:hypothetical protein
MIEIPTAFLDITNCSKGTVAATIKFKVIDLFCQDKKFELAARK